METKSPPGWAIFMRKDFVFPRLRFRLAAILIIYPCLIFAVILKVKTVILVLVIKLRVFCCTGWSRFRWSRGRAGGFLGPLSFGGRGLGFRLAYFRFLFCPPCCPSFPRCFYSLALFGSRPALISLAGRGSLGRDHFGTLTHAMRPPEAAGALRGNNSPLPSPSFLAAPAASSTGRCTSTPILRRLKPNSVIICMVLSGTFKARFLARNTEPIFFSIISGVLTSS